MPHACRILTAHWPPMAEQGLSSLPLGTIAGQSWPLLTLAGVTLGLALFAAWAAVRILIYQREKTAAGQYLETLARLESQDLLNEAVIDRLPPLPGDPFWSRLADLARDSLLRHAAWVQDQTLARTALELKMGRCATELDRLRSVFRNIEDPILALDQFDEVVLANRSAEALFAFQTARAEQRAMRNLIRCEKLVHLLSTTAQRKTVGSRCDEIEIQDAQGQTHWFRVIATKFAETGAADAATGTLAVLRDIGDQKALQKRNAEFVSSVSHEMKTPLAGIKAYVELLVDGDAEDDQTREEFLNVINGQADRLQRLVDNLLNLARIEAGVVQVSKQHHSLNELLDEALRVVQPSAEAKNIELSADLSPLYLGVLADRDMLLQAAINLLSNAIKYTSPGGRVTLRSRMEGDHVRFEVSDTGVGLGPEDCQRVFEKFYRVNKDKHMAAGTGLGLPLAKHIVEDVHGGQLTVESVLGQGSTFAATLPNAGQMS